MELTKDILKELAKPFPASSISIKIQTKPNEKGNALCVAYIDARDVMNRLDEVVGGEWSDVYTKAPSGGLECALTICGVTRRDVGDDQNDNEQEKAGYSDAFKRAAVKFGIGRFLYSMPKMYGAVKQVGKNSYLADGEEKRLQGILQAALNGKALPPSEERTRVVSESKPAAKQAEKPEGKKSDITDDMWKKFGQVAQHAASDGIELPEYNREKMNAKRIEGATKYIQSKIEAKEKAGK